MAEIQQFDRVIAELKRRFPSLRIRVDLDPHPELAAVANIPPQPGLEFGFSFNLQRDELHLNVGGSFWVEFFPCYDTKVTDQFIEAINGILTGTYRIVEYCIGEEPVKAQLQRPLADDQWQSVATWSSLGALIPWRRRQNVIQNKAGGPSTVGAGA